MFPLFELAKLIHFSSESKKPEQTASVRQIAWKEVGDRSFLAVLFSNGYLILRYVTHGSVPIVRQLPWHPDRPVQCMTFDPSATWLLCITQKDVLYVVPALALMDTCAQIEPLWKLDDITRIKLRRRRGELTCLTWWRTFSGDQVAIVGTKLGYVLIVDLQAQRVMSETDVNENVSNIEVLHDDSQTETHALIMTKSNNRWEMLLETKDRTDSSGEGDGLTTIPIGFEYVPISILQYPESRASDFALKRIQQFSNSTFLTPVTINGKSMVAARDLHSKQLKLYNHTLEGDICATYIVPEVVDEVVITDKLLFFTSTNERSCLQVVATLLDEVHSLKDTEDFDTETVVQAFHLNPSERILAVFRRSYPFYWHEKRQEEKRKGSSVSSSGYSGFDKLGHSVDSTIPFHISQHTVLDGCLIVTTHNAYECRPRISPEVLFVELAMSRSDPGSAKNLAAVLGLKVNWLYHLAAQVQLIYQDYAQASRFFQLAKSPHLQRVGAFAKYGHMSEVVQYLRQMLDSKHHELQPAEMEQLSDMMVLTYMQQLLEDKGRTNELTYQLREFLMINKHYSTEEAMDTLVENGFHEIALSMGTSRGCLFEVLEKLVGTDGTVSLVKEALRDIPHGKLDMLRHSPLLQYLSPADLVSMLEDQPSFALDFLSHFQMILNDLDLATLRRVVPLYDISHAHYQRLMSDRQLEIPKSNNSEDLSSSMHSVYTKNVLDNGHQQNTETSKQLVNFFARCVILLNGLLGQDMLLSFTEDTFTPLYPKARSLGGDRQYRLAVRHRLVSAGSQHSALIHNEQLYIWGDCSQQGFPDKPQKCEGSTLHANQDVECRDPELWRPYTPAAFQAMRIVSISCGAQHSMAITDKGVYGWGDCRYGQLGIGRAYGGTVDRPQRVEGVIDARCVDLVCGNYHTVALLEDCTVCTWGWGIHGQLGHGDSEDVYVPKALSIPSDARVAEIAVGYAHTVLLTEMGRVYACGSGIFGQLGLGTTCKHQALKHVVGLPDDVISVAAKYFHCVAVTSDSTVYQWGASPTQLCDAVREHRHGGCGRTAPTPAMLRLQQQYLTPATVDTYNVVAKIIRVECGNNFSALVTEDGELFTWGRNFDGQLGIGNRIDQKYPVMVNRINDQKVAAIGCGADHMVVMDTNHQVWSWGRNDLGQLAVVTSHSSSSPGDQGIYVSMGIYVAVWPTKGPSINKITARAPGHSLPSMASIQHAAGQWHLVMPHLAPYSCDILFTVLQYLLVLCDCSHWLRQCVDYHLWGTAASLALHQELLPLALRYHLTVLSQSTSGNVTQCTASSHSIHQQLLLMADFYLRKLEPISLEDFNIFIQTAQDILCQLGEAWVLLGLDPMLFVNTITKHLELLAWPFFLLMTRTVKPNAATPQASSDDGRCSLTLPVSLISSLPVPFCLQVTMAVIHHLEEGSIPREETNSHGVGSVERSGFSMEGLSLLPQQQILENKLWDETLRNTRKEGSEETTIMLSGHQLEALTAAVDAASLVSVDGDRGSSSAVVFSCGHHMPWRTLTTERVGDLEAALIGEMDMPQSAALLRFHYSSQGLMSVACPQCVLDTIRMS